MAYTVVAVCVVLLRYDVSDDDDVLADDRDGFFEKLLNTSNLKYPTNYTSRLVTIAVSIYAFLCAILCLIISLLGDDISGGNYFLVFLVIVLSVAKVVLLTVIARQPKSSKQLTFSVPCTPFIPGLSIFMNIYLLAQLGWMAWVRFGVWMAVGLLIYVFYSRRYSKVKELSLLNDAMDEAFDQVDGDGDYERIG